jgi:hypothetical protein
MTPFNFGVVVDLGFAMLLRRDHGLRATFDDVHTQPIGVESLICK